MFLVHQGFIYASFILSLITAVLVFRWRDRRGKHLLAWAMVFSFLRPVVSDVSLFLSNNAFIGGSIVSRAIIHSEKLTIVLSAILLLWYTLIVFKTKEEDLNPLFAWAVGLWFFPVAISLIALFLQLVMGLDPRRLDFVAMVLFVPIITGKTMSHILLCSYAYVHGKSECIEPQNSGCESETNNTPIYFYVPMGRLVFMGFVSMGFYEVYWLYKNWKYIKERDHLNIVPLLRGIFGIFFCHKLFRIIHDDPQNGAANHNKFSAGILASGWVMVVILGNLLSLIPNSHIAISLSYLATLSFLFFVPVQHFINKVNESRNRSMKYHSWTIGHFLCIVIGVLFWILVFLVPDHII